jgi:hypothetical protein
VYQIVEASGGTVQAQPHPPSGSKFRPDFLVWLGQQEPELLDPAVIEVKGYVDSNDVRKFEQQLLSFMEAAGVRTGLVVTAGPVPPREQHLSVNVFWLDLQHFEKLVRTSRLGAYIRDTRNRMAHGVR